MPSMKDLFGDTPAPLPQPPAHRAFDGATYEPPRDHERLKGQLEAVYELMKDGNWRILTVIAARVKGSEAAVSARLRDLRKPKYGGHVVERRRMRGAKSGLYEYRIGGRG